MTSIKKTSYLFTLLLIAISSVASQWNYNPPNELFLRPKDMFPTNQRMRSLLQLRSKINKSQSKHQVIEKSLHRLKFTDHPQWKLQARHRPELNAHSRPDLQTYTPVNYPPPVPTELNDIDDDISNIRFVEPPVVRLNAHTNPEPVKMRVKPLLLCGYKELPQDYICYNNQPYSVMFFGVCGTRIYKKQTQFCYNGQTYDLLRKGICGNNIYDKMGQVCINKDVESICGGQVFDPHTHFCYEKVYARSQFSLCKKKVYRKKTHFCYKGKVIKKAKMEPRLLDHVIAAKNLPPFWGMSPKGVSAMRSLQLMHPNAMRKMYPYPINSSIKKSFPVPTFKKQSNLHDNFANSQFKALLGSTLFRNFATNNPKSIFGEQTRGQKKDFLPRKFKGISKLNSNLSKRKLDLCGSTKYNDETHFCYKNRLNRRCGKISYNPALLICFNNFVYKKEIYDICGKNLYNKFTQACQNNQVFQRRNLLPTANEKGQFNDIGSDNELELNDNIVEGELLKDAKNAKRLENLILKYKKKLLENEDKDLLQYSKTILNQRHVINTSAKRCISSNPKNEFCFRNNLYNRLQYGLCGKQIFHKQNYQCLNGRVLFPALRKSFRLS